MTLPFHSSCIISCECSHLEVSFVPWYHYIFLVNIDTPSPAIVFCYSRTPSGICRTSAGHSIAEILERVQLVRLNLTRPATTCRDWSSRSSSFLFPTVVRVAAIWRRMLGREMRSLSTCRRATSVHDLNLIPTLYGAGSADPHLLRDGQAHGRPRSPGRILTTL